MAPLDTSRPVPAVSALVGLALIAVSATAYGVVPIFARLAYDAGATPLTLLSLRYVAACVALLAALLLRRRPLLLPRERRFAGVVTGGFLAIIAWSYLAAIRMIPVSLAALLFFTYPLIVTLVGWLRGERVAIRRAAAVIIAFVGLAIALGVEIGELNPLGIGLGMLSSLTYAVAIFYFGRATSGGDPLTVNLHAMTTCAVLFVPLALANHALAIPDTSLGRLGVFGVVASYFTGVVAFFAALPRIGAIKTALLSQLEPAVSILAAVLILKEQLTPFQGVGVAMLLTSLILLAR